MTWAHFLQHVRCFFAGSVSSTDVCTPPPGESTSLFATLGALPVTFVMGVPVVDEPAPCMHSTRG